MFKNTNHFFRKVFEGEVTFTEQDNYIESISCNYDLKKLKTLSFDLTIFISNKIEELESGIDNDQIASAFERYKELGLEVPYKDVLNLNYFFSKFGNLPLENIPKNNRVVDLMEMFYGRELFNIRSLQHKIRASGNKQLANKEQELEKESLFRLKSNSPQQNETILSCKSSQLHPNFNPNLWNRDCFELFKYLFDNYYSKTKRQLINIWFYLNENGIDKYNLKASKNAYKDFIFEHYKVKITNDEKAKFKYEDKEFSTLQDHRVSFENSLK